MSPVNKKVRTTPRRAKRAHPIEISEKRFASKVIDESQGDVAGVLKMRVEGYGFDRTLVVTGSYMAKTREFKAGFISYEGIPADDIPLGNNGEVAPGEKVEMLGLTREHMIKQMRNIMRRRGKAIMLDLREQLVLASLRVKQPH